MIRKRKLVEFQRLLVRLKWTHTLVRWNHLPRTTQIRYIRALRRRRVWIPRSQIRPIQLPRKHVNGFLYGSRKSRTISVVALQTMRVLLKRSSYSPLQQPYLKDTLILSTKERYSAQVLKARELLSADLASRRRIQRNRPAPVPERPRLQMYPDLRPASETAIYQLMRLGDGRGMGNERNLD